MSRKKWVSAGEDGGGLRPPTDEELLKLGEEEIVVLLSGFNNFGDKIYNYLKMKFKNYYPLRMSIKGGGRFDIRDFGEVIAAGMGAPTNEVRQEMESQFKMIAFPKSE